MRQSRNIENGFTLIELMLSIAISGIVLAAITATFISQSRSYDAQAQINGMQQGARAAMDIITREVRMAGYDPTDAGISGIVICNATTIQLRADVVVPADGLTTGTNEDITYTFDDPNDQILRDAEILVENIDLADFDCLDSGGLPTATVANVRQIQVTITTITSKPDPNYTPNGGYRTFTLTSLITPRNLAF